MLGPEQCPGLDKVELEEVGLEEVQEWRECKSEGSVQVEEGRSSWRKVWSWTWKCPKSLVDLTEEAEWNRRRPEPELDVPFGVGLHCRQG